MMRQVKRSTKWPRCSASATPGGPRIDAPGKIGNPKAIRFPRTWLDREGFDFSFSGIKTAVLYHVRDNGLPQTPEGMNDLCASFQDAVVDVLVEKTIHAAQKTGVRDVTVAGGVSANSRLRVPAERRVRETWLPSFPSAHGVLHGQWCDDRLCGLDETHARRPFAPLTSRRCSSGACLTP